jgi:hypothetical protein
MPPDPDKRKLRELKRALKKRGNRHRRQQLKRGLTVNPEGAAEAEESLGRHRSDAFNGLDQDSTRKRGEASRGEQKSRSGEWSPFAPRTGGDGDGMASFVVEDARPYPAVKESSYAPGPAILRNGWSPLPV